MASFITENYRKNASVNIEEWAKHYARFTEAEMEQAMFEITVLKQKCPLSFYTGCEKCTYFTNQQNFLKHFIAYKNTTCGNE